MLASITPLGERGRNRRWATTAAFYTSGSIAGGALRGALLGAAGSLLPAPWRPSPAGVGLVLAALLVAAAASEKGWLPIAVPGPHRQVDEAWLESYRGWVVGVGFGAQLGFAGVTYITSAATYVVFAAEVLTFTWRGGMALGAVFGAARAVPLLAAAWITTPQRLRLAHARMGGAAAAAHSVVALVFALAAVALVAGAIV
ncbi:MAG TPA: hypothetical protein VGC11_06130 [Acidimicrobiia bacterium]|jgi:MFS family permease